MKKYNRFLVFLLITMIIFSGIGPLAEAASKQRQYVSVIDLNLRSKGNDRASPVIFVPEGKTLEYAGETTSNGYFKLSYEGKVGYVMRGDVTSKANYESTDTSIHNIPVKNPNGKIFKTVKDLNLRTGNENRYRSIKLMPRGSEVKHLGRTSNDWFKIDYKGTPGYVYRGDVTSKANYDSTDTTIHKIPVTGSRGKVYKTIIGQSLRTGDSNQYRAIEFIPRGEEVVYLGTTAKNWFKVSYEGTEGYIYRGDVTSTGKAESIRIETRGLVFNTGKSSDQIRLLKDFFRARKANNVGQGYDYDNRTKQLVRDYQKSKGLQVDGIAGKLTLGKVNNEIRDKGYKIGLYIPNISVKGDMLLINKSSNTLYFIKNGSIQESYPVATGKTASLTPNGKFNIVVKFRNPSWGGAGISPPIAGGAPNNPLGKRWLGISYGGGGQYGVHGNANSGSIGTYASLGCVRMFNKDIESLYEKVKVGTPIWIGNEKQLESYGVKFKSNYNARSTQAKSNIISNEEDLKIKKSSLNENNMEYYSFDEIFELINGDKIIDEEIDENMDVTGGYDVEYLPDGE